MTAKIIIEDGEHTYIGYVGCELHGKFATLGEGWREITVNVEEQSCDK